MSADNNSGSCNHRCKCAKTARNLSTEPQATLTVPPLTLPTGLQLLDLPFAEVGEIGSNEDEWEVVTVELPWDELGGES